MGATNLPNGLSVNTQQHLLGSMPLPNPARVHLFFDDFDLFVPSAVDADAVDALPWRINITAGGDIEPNALGVGINGSTVTLTTNNSASARTLLMSRGAGFDFQLGKAQWCEFEFIPRGDPDIHIMHFGMMPDTSAIPDNGMFFVCGGFGSNEFTTDFRVRSNNAYTVNLTTNMVPVVDVPVSLGVRWDGVDTFAWYLNGVLSGNVTVTEDDLPIGTFAAQMAIQAVNATTETVDVDYVLAAQER